MEEIKLQSKNIFYKINNIIYKRSDLEKKLGFIFCDQNHQRINISDLNSIHADMIKPDGTVVNIKTFANTQENNIITSFLKSECNLYGIYEFKLKIGDVQFQKFLFTVSEFTDEFLFKVGEKGETKNSDCDLVISKDEPNSKYWLKLIQ